MEGEGENNNVRLTKMEVHAGALRLKKGPVDYSLNCYYYYYYC